MRKEKHGKTGDKKKSGKSRGGKGRGRTPKRSSSKPANAQSDQAHVYGILNRRHGPDHVNEAFATRPHLVEAFELDPLQFLTDNEVGREFRRAVHAAERKSRRRRAKSFELKFEVPSGSDDPEEALIKEEEHAEFAECARWVRDLLKTLPRAERSAVYHRYMEGQTYARIARLIECSPKKARALVKAGLAKLIELVDEETEVDGSRAGEWEDRWLNG